MASTNSPTGKRATRKSGTSKPKIVVRNASGGDLLDGFRDFVLEDSDVQEALRKVKTARDVTKLAAKYGYVLSVRDVQASARMSGGGLSVDELGGLIGGAPCWCSKSVVNSKSCKKK
jgi:hypothetical protein